jgi:hypothetical protein
MFHLVGAMSDDSKNEGQLDSDKEDEPFDGSDPGSQGHEESDSQGGEEEDELDDEEDPNLADKRKKLWDTFLAVHRNGHFRQPTDGCLFEKWDHVRRCFCDIDDSTRKACEKYTKILNATIESQELWMDPFSSRERANQNQGGVGTPSATDILEGPAKILWAKKHVLLGGRTTFILGLGFTGTAQTARN